jgi:hypothetical protein
MRRFARCMLVASSCILGLALVSRAGGDREADAIIAKAIKAHLGDNKSDAKRGYKGKSKGTLHILGMEFEFTQEITLEIPKRFKEVINMTIRGENAVMGQNVIVKSVFDGKKAWIRVNDKDIDVDEDLLAEFKEAVNLMGISQGIFVRNKSLKLSLLGEVQVNGKPALGVKVSKKGKDVNYYFDKATGLTAKVERRAKDFMNGKEVTEERIITEYQKVSGRQSPKKMLINRDGKKFLEAEVLETQFLDRIDDKEFAKPE